MDGMNIQKKEFKYRGKTLEELKTMDTREFAKLLPSKQRRFVLRNFQEIEKFVSRCKMKQEKKKKIKTHSRNIVIVPQLVGMNIQVYNGREFIPIEIVGEMLGHVLGEFSLTRAKIMHSKAGVGATKGSKHKSKK
jgi:small subunit ribosomal protein S19